jgi:hypothetical protein
MALVLPHSAVCLVGEVPSTGLSGRLAGMVGLGCNCANPELCNRCNSPFVVGDLHRRVTAMTMPPLGAR